MYKFRKGLTLVELLVAMVFAFIMILGTLNMTYHSSLETNQSEADNTAGRIANMLLEGWKISGGSVYFDPVDAFGQNIEIRQLDRKDDITSNTGTLTNIQGYYEIDINNVIYRAVFSWRKEIGSRIKTLNVSVIWTHKKFEWDPQSGTEKINLTGFIEDLTGFIED